MRIIRKILALIKAVFCWYAQPVPGQKIYRAEIITLVVVIFSLLAVDAYVGDPQETMTVVYDPAAALRELPLELENRANFNYEEGWISGYDRETTLQRIAEMKPVFDEYADLMTQRGMDPGQQVLVYESLRDVLQSNDPRGLAGRLIFGAGNDYGTFGNRLNVLIGLHRLGQHYSTIDYEGNPFQSGDPIVEEINQLRVRLQEVFDRDRNDLFLARMQGVIMQVSDQYTRALWENPCDREGARAPFLSEPWTSFLSRMPVFGPGERWPDYESFLDWVISQAPNQLDAHAFDKTWVGTWQGDFFSTDECNACTPPEGDGLIRLTVEVQYCTLSGSIEGGWEGYQSVPYCQDGVPTDFIRSAYGKHEYSSGKVYGWLDPSGTIVEAWVDFEGQYTMGWVGEPYNEGPFESTWIFSGTLDWEGNGSGSFEPKLPPIGCMTDVSWNVQPE